MPSLKQKSNRKWIPLARAAISRLEIFSDVNFGLAMTLLVVSLQVQRHLRVS